MRDKTREKKIRLIIYVTTVRWRKLKNLISNKTYETEKEEVEDEVKKKKRR